MPLHRLNQKPTRLGDLADLTCNCDGRLSHLISDGHSKPLLELHALRPNKPCLVGMFLGGTYQEVMGNLHNVFGSTDAVQIRLAAWGDYRVEHVPDLLLERLQVPSEQAISNGPRRIGEARRRMDHLKSSMRQSTYLQS